MNNLAFLFSLRIIYSTWARSLVGRAPALQAGGREFESPRVHYRFNLYLIM